MVRESEIAEAWQKKNCLGHRSFQRTERLELLPQTAHLIERLASWSSAIELIMNYLGAGESALQVLSSLSLGFRLRGPPASIRQSFLRKQLQCSKSRYPLTLFFLPEVPRMVKADLGCPIRQLALTYRVV